MLRQQLAQKVSDVLEKLIASGDLPDAARVEFEILDTKNPEHGDYSCNLALIAAKPAGMNPRAIGEKLQKALASDAAFAAVDIAGPGFLNFKLKPETVSRFVGTVLELGEKLPSALAEPSSLPKVEVEFVSVNPNGPITVGSGRGAAFGDTLSRILHAAGSEVTREYYINDGVNSEQMRLFAESVRAYVRNEPLPEKGYKGDYVKGVADDLLAIGMVAGYYAHLLINGLPAFAKLTEIDVYSFTRDSFLQRLGQPAPSVPEDYPSEELFDICVEVLKEDDTFLKTHFVSTRLLERAVMLALGVLAFTVVENRQVELHEVTSRSNELVEDAKEYAVSLEPDTKVKVNASNLYVAALGTAKELVRTSPPEQLASASLEWFQTISQDLMIERQRTDLHTFGVDFDIWFSEQKDLHEKGKVTEALKWLEANGNAYRAIKPRVVETEVEAKPDEDDDAVVEDGKEALWLASCSNNLGDDKDRVLLRADGRPTYLAAEVAYLKDKFDRGYGKCFLILGPDHHGYIGRTYAVVKAIGKEPVKDFEIVIFQIVRFVKDGKPAPMRKRDGNIYELRDLIQELGQAVAPNESKDEQERIGRDVSRFFYLMRSHETHMDFDIDLATKQSDENPVFYVQYAHARICGVLRKAEEALGSGLEALGRDINTSLLIHERERTLIKKILDLPEEVQRTAKDYGVHRIANYAIELARTFHHFYDACRVIQPEEPELSKARLALVKAAQIGLKSALDLLGVSAPEKMERAALETGA